MDELKNYYQILGVHPTAEIFIIKAAYRVLAQKYHPDKNMNSVDATQKMIDINEAYETLSDRSRREEYDKKYKTNFEKSINSSPDEEDIELEEAFEQALSETEESWAIIVDLFPNLKIIREELQVIAHRLAYSFVVYTLQSRNFDKAEEVAKKMKRDFLEDHFGTDPKIIDFATSLINLRFRDAVRGLNKIIFVVGTSVPATKIIDSIKLKYDLKTRLKNLDTSLGKTLWFKWYAADESIISLVKKSTKLDDLYDLLNILNFHVEHKGGKYSVYEKNTMKHLQNLSSFSELRWYLEHRISVALNE